MKTNFGIFVDEEGIYRYGWKLHKARLSFECKHPAMIPKDHHITELIINDSHNRVKVTLFQVRSQYWIKNGQQVVKKIISKCVTWKDSKEFYINHYQQHHYQISELTNKHNLNIQVLIIMNLCISSKSYQAELYCLDDLRNHKNDTVRISERFISNITCSMFEDIRRKKMIVKINIIRQWKNLQSRSA